MSTSDDAALSAAINSVTDAATSAIRKTLRPADDTVSPDDLAAAQALVEATTAATVKAVQDAISARMRPVRDAARSLSFPDHGHCRRRLRRLVFLRLLPSTTPSERPSTIPPVHPSTTPLVRPSTTPDLTCQASSPRSASILLNNMTTSLLVLRPGGRRPAPTPHGAPRQSSPPSTQGTSFRCLDLASTRSRILQVSMPLPRHAQQICPPTTFSPTPPSPTMRHGLGWIASSSHGYMAPSPDLPRSFAVPSQRR